MSELINPESEFLLYQTESGETRIQVRMLDETATPILVNTLFLFQLKGLERYQRSTT